MQYFKIVDGDYITAVGIGNAGMVIGEDEYEEINTASRTMPTAPAGTLYRLRDDTLEWELVELPPMPEPEDEPSVEDKAEAFDILIGVTP